MSMVSPSERLRNSAEPTRNLLMSSGFGLSACRREKASSRCVSDAARCALRTAHGVIEGALQVGLLDLARVALRRFQIPEHDHEEIVEIVGDAAAELSDRIHLLRRRQLFLRVA